jgi:hypothetical protein
MRIAMRKHNLAAFRATTLTYSSPVVGTTNTTPDFFYNAFPDLNDVATDGSRSAFPQRAKYLLSFDSIFLPSAMLIDTENIDEERLSSLDPPSHRMYAEIASKYRYRNRTVNFPKTPELDKIHHIETLFEVGHKRLANADCMFQTLFLAPFYTTLENHLVRGDEIGVPLVDDDSNRASLLQRHWKAVNDTFKSTVLLNETASLLCCVLLLPPEEGQARERGWLLEEATEIDGFADYYRKLRGKFNPESSIAETDRLALAEQLIKYAKRVLSSRPIDIFLAGWEVYGNREEIQQRVFWPGLLDETVHHGLRQLRLRNDMILGLFENSKLGYVVAARLSIPQALQWFMASMAMRFEEERRFTPGVAAWTEHVGFYLENAEDIAYPRITFLDTSYFNFQTLVHDGFRKPDGSEIKFDPDLAPTDVLIAHSICRYAIFLESIRQQVCTGVGLRCPFWKGSGCCRFRPLLQRTYEVAKPWHPYWKHHWQRPSCL